MTTIYKICPKSLWDEAEHIGHFAGAEIDLQDGFIHFSTSAQLEETARLHFNGIEGLVLVAVDSAVLDIIWEPSRGGTLFPHLYSTLPLSAVLSVEPMPPGQNGVPCPENGFPNS